MQCECPHCLHLVSQDRNPEGLNYCPACHKLFYMPPPERKVPGWLLGVLVVLAANAQVLHRILG